MKENARPVPVRPILAVDETLSLGDTLQRIADLIAIHGETVPVRLKVGEHRTVKVSRRDVEEALRHPEKKTLICLNLWCSHVGQVFHEGQQAHDECATYPLTPLVLLEPHDQKAMAAAILEELNLGVPDSSYQPEAEWHYID